MGKKDLIIPALVNALCGLALGYNSSIVNGLKNRLIKFTYFDEVPNEDLLSTYYGLYTSALLFGMVAGSSVGVWLADKIGRRKSLILGGLILTVIPIILAVVKNYWGAFVLRIIVGFAVGLTSCVGPMYVTETVDVEYRGRIGGMYQLIVTLSMAFGYFMNMAFAKNEYDDNKPFDQWQWSCQYAIGAFVGLLILVCCLFAKETDVWLNKQKNGNAQQQQNQTKVTVNETVDTAGKIKWYSFAVIFGCCGQLCGINAVMYYSNDILGKAGLTNPFIATACVTGLWNFASTALAMPFIDKFKRRTLLISTYFGLAVGNLVMAISYEAHVTALSIVGIVIFLFMFEWGPGPLFWVVASEAFPGPIRSSGLSVSVTANNLANIVISFTFPILQEKAGPNVVFYIFTGVSAFASVYCFFFLPESSTTTVKESETKAVPATTTTATTTSSTPAVSSNPNEVTEVHKEGQPPVTTVELPAKELSKEPAQPQLPTVA